MVKLATIIIIAVIILGGVAITTNLTGNAITGSIIKMTNNPRILMQTSEGDIELELYPNKAPATVENFLNYVNAGHYDGTVFHRVIKNFMIQGGGFAEDGKEKLTNAPIKLESNNGLKNNKGTIAMARTMVKDSATSQFFINTVDNDFLNYVPGNPGYAVFGKVTKGMEIVEKIENTQTTTKQGMQDWPVQDIVIEKVNVI
jgi:peptidyl-prolyl cis-trans isomerase A (cyclophilin A)